MLVKSCYKKINISFKKILLLINKIKLYSIENILLYLNFINNKISKILKKLFLSVLSNAKNNFNLEIKNLKIYEIFVEKYRYLKRPIFGSRGRFNFHNKYYSNIKLILITNFN